MVLHLIKVIALALLGLLSSMAFSSGFQPGDNPVTTVEFKKGVNGSPVDTLIFVPEVNQESELELVYINHGFLVQHQFYKKIAQHIASHGYIVILPQMYRRSPLPLFKPSFDKEAELGAEILNWINLKSPELFGVTLTSATLAGHSRGGTVIWRILRHLQMPVKAMIGIDPVNGKGKDAITTNLLAAIPSLNIAAALSGSCAPSHRNYDSFIKSSHPAVNHWFLFAENFGHMDMLDTNCGLVCGVCKSGSGSRDEFISSIAGSVVTFMGSLGAEDNGKQGEMEEYVSLTPGYQFKIY